MTATFLLLSLIATLAKSGPIFKVEIEWQLWKTEHGKSYGSQREELERHLVWLSNREYINAHNKNSEIFSYTLAMNHLGDMTDREFAETHLNHYTARNGYKEGQGKSDELAVNPTRSESDLPQSRDWRQHGKVSAVKNEGQCSGASYAFSAVGAIESAVAIKTGKLTNMSVQSIVDCSVSFGNRGCEGGSVNAAFEYVISSAGINTEKSYPYTEKQGACNFDKNSVKASISSFTSIGSGSESELKEAVARIGPVAVAIDASDKAFRYYKSGIYSSTLCSPYNLNHPLLVVGYGTYSSVDYWIVKNCWNTNWGMGGYILMSRNRYNQCGIASSASYPTVQ